MEAGGGANGPKSERTDTENVEGKRFRRNVGSKANRKKNRKTSRRKKRSRAMIKLNMLRKIKQKRNKAGISDQKRLKGGNVVYKASGSNARTDQPTGKHRVRSGFC